MTDYRTILERDLERVARPASFTFDDVSRRRNRKRRNQRIAAGVVGIAVFVAAVWVVTSGWSLDRSETSVVPGGATGPAETGPAVTGPTVAPDAGWDGYGIPPEGTVLSTPVEGTVIAEFSELHVGWVFVYADGRVLWCSGCSGPILERRLSPDGVELVRSGAIEPVSFLLGGSLGLPASAAWEDPESRPYAAPRYAVCYVAPDRPKDGEPWYAADPSRALDLLPAQAQELLRGKERTYSAPHFIAPHNAKCSEVTTEEVLALREIFNLSFEHLGGPAYNFSLGPDEAAGLPFEIAFHPVLPHGTWVSQGG